MMSFWRKIHWIQSLKPNQSLLNFFNATSLWLKVTERQIIFIQISIFQWACAVTPKKIIDSICFYLYHLNIWRKERENFRKLLSSSRGLTKLKMFLMRSIQILGLPVFMVYNEMCQHFKDLHNSLNPSGQCLLDVTKPYIWKRSIHWYDPSFPFAASY